jgi:hypothetical protein
MTSIISLPRVALFAATLALAACGSSFKTDYPAPIPASQAASWRLADVQVVVPASLTVSEEAAAFPKADIVWREDPPGDRKAQVAAIIDAAATAGASGLRGSNPVIIRLTVTRFHALTPEAEALPYDNVGVLNIDFIAEVIDASSGAVLVPATSIEAALPGKVGIAAAAAKKAGITQKAQISSHVRRVIAGWLGLGPDPRMEFSRIGG